MTKQPIKWPLFPQVSISEPLTMTIKLPLGYTILSEKHPAIPNLTSYSASRESYDWGHFFIGDYNFGLGKFQKTISHLEKVSQLHPKYEDTCYMLGLSYFEFDKLKDSKHFLINVSEKNLAHHINARCYLGRISFKSEQYEESIVHFRYVLEKKPEHLYAHHTLGKAICMHSSEKREEAIEHFRFVLNKDADNEYVKYWLGIALYESGQRSEAMPFLNAVPIGNTYHDYAQLLIGGVYDTLTELS